MFTKKTAFPSSIPVEIPTTSNLFKEKIPGIPDRLSITPYGVGSAGAQSRLTFMLQQLKSTPPSVVHPGEDTQAQKSVPVSLGP